MTVGYDSVNAFNIPLIPGTLILGYIDGLYKWSPGEWARFVNHIKGTITVFGNIYANIADVENGDMTPADARNWIEEKQAKNLGPCIVYCDLANRPMVDEACHGLSYYQFLADWTGQPHDVDGAVAVQYASLTSLGYDLSEWYNPGLIPALDNANRPWRWG